MAFPAKSLSLLWHAALLLRFPVRRKWTSLKLLSRDVKSVLRATTGRTNRDGRVLHRSADYPGLADELERPVHATLVARFPAAVWKHWSDRRYSRLLWFKGHAPDWRF